MMQFDNAKQSFIANWGELGTKWGISKTKAQMHALLLISPNPLCTDQIMAELEISRGNACMNLKGLSDWGLVHKKCMEGCRKEYYYAEKDIFIVFRQILIHRKKEELEPLLMLLDNCSSVEESCQDSTEFCKIIKELKIFSSKADTTLDKLLQTNPNWFVTSFLRMIP